MTRILRTALLGDGSSDCALLPILAWVLEQCVPDATLGPPGFRARSGRELEEEMHITVKEHRPHVLFVHRDAERIGLEQRYREIPSMDHPLVRVVPVRMTEAWLLFDESAIRTAAGRPSGRARLDLPPLSQIEKVADPKERLHEALRMAADVTGRKLKRLRRDTGALVQRVAELIRDFSPLRNLPAFASFEAECASVFAKLK